MYRSFFYTLPSTTLDRVVFLWSLYVCVFFKSNCLFMSRGVKSLKKNFKACFVSPRSLIYMCCARFCSTFWIRKRVLLFSLSDLHSFWFMCLSTEQQGQTTLCLVVYLVKLDKSDNISVTPWVYVKHQHQLKYTVVVVC